MSEYACQKCGQGFDDLNEFKGHNMRCKKPEEPKSDETDRPQRNEKRRERVPLGVPRRKLAWKDQDEDYVYRVIHNRPNKPNRVNEALKAGYEFVKDDRHLGDEDVSNEMGASIDSRVTAIVGTGEKGEAMTGYLMRIKREWYEEDQAKKQEIVNKREEAILTGIDEKGRPGADGRYIPTAGGVPITHIERS